MRTIKRLQLMVLAVATGTLLLAGIASAAGLEVKVKEGIGSYLVDKNGVTLYLFKNDIPGKSVCDAASGCLNRWPIFLADETPGEEVDAAAIGVITRDDGAKQTTYHGFPLYYFFKDKAAGDTLGQGVNNVWYVVAP